jgi:hypothetical protein
MGLVIVLLTAPVHRYDVLADPFGWLLVLVGFTSLPVPQRGTLRALGAVSLVVSAVVWVPAVRDGLNVTDLSLAWAVGLPELATVFVLAHALAEAAWGAGDSTARRWLLTARTLVVVTALLPAVVLGGGFDSWDSALGVVSSLSLLLLIVLLFRYAARPWARPADAAVDAPTP